MPGTPQEYVTLARQIADGILAPDYIRPRQWADGSDVTAVDQLEIFALAMHEIRLRQQQRPPAQRRAMRLLRSLLSAEQLQQLRRRKVIRLFGSAGGHYELSPCTGMVRALERHGMHFYSVRSFCLHEPDGDPILPPADRSVAHLLMLLTDEPAFVATANVTERRPDCWNGEWRRRLNAARRQRAAEVQS